MCCFDMPAQWVAPCLQWAAGESNCVPSPPSRPTGALWALDLATMRWEQVGVSQPDPEVRAAANRAAPPPRAGHTLTSDGVSSLLVFGGQGPVTYVLFFFRTPARRVCAGGSVGHISSACRGFRRDMRC